MARTLINIPKTAKRGDIIEIKTLISHIMETGFRRNSAGQPYPRNIITKFVCTYNGEQIFGADLFPAIALHHFLYRCNREWLDCLRVEWRQRLSRDCVGHDCGRMIQVRSMKIALGFSKSRQSGPVRLTGVSDTPPDFSFCGPFASATAMQ